MKRKNIVITIFLVVLSISFLFGLSRYYEEPVFAEVSCPSHIDPDSLECLDYLRKQMEIVQKQQSSLQRQLEEEEYEQLTLEEKITYINNRILSTENSIKELEVEIAALNIEIGLLEESVNEKEENIAVLGQEINTLQDAVNKRVAESYKYSFVGPLELFLDTKSLSSILRKTKYLIETRNQDRLYLEEFSNKSEILKEEEATLSEEKAEIQYKRNSIDENRIELAKTKQDLDAQKAVRESLLAESKAKEARLLAEYQANLKKVADLDKAIINYINTHESEIIDEGWVTTAMPIGRMGNTGWSDGAHLHFGLNSGKKYPGLGYFYSDIDIFARGYLIKGPNSFLKWGPPCDWEGPCPWWSPIIYAGSVRVPLSGAYILMTQDDHQGHAIDLVSYSQNAWGEHGEYKNDGAPVYPIMDGQLYKGVDGYGGKYAVVHHSNGLVSVYLHLQ
jgi:peptidoglycan hydrolase CwlO-like protein